MSFLKRQQVRPGLAGMASRPIPPEEAQSIVNLRLDRDGTWTPRAGLVRRAGYNSPITYLGNHPGNADIILIEGGRLKRVDSTTFATLNTYATNWPTSVRLKATIGGNTAGGLWWIAPRAAMGDPVNTLYRIDTSGGFASLKYNPQASVVENFGDYTTLVELTRVVYSAPGDSNSWPALNWINAPRELGVLRELVALSQNQMLLVGDHGLGILSGTSTETFSVTEVIRTQSLGTSVPAVKVGDRVYLMGFGNRIYVYGPSLQRIDEPVEEDLKNLGRDVFLWHDPFQNHLMIGSNTEERTYLFSLERNRWMGWIDRPLVGHADFPSRGSATGLLVGVNTTLAEFDRRAYTDFGDPMTCMLEVGPEYQQLPEGLKQLRSVFVDGRGDWTVTLLGRRAVDDDWNTLGSMVVSAPGWAGFGLHTYRDRLLRLEATANSALVLRGLALDERLVRVEY